MLRNYSEKSLPFLRNVYPMNLRPGLSLHSYKGHDIHEFVYFTPFEEKTWIQSDQRKNG